MNVLGAASNSRLKIVSLLFLFSGLSSLIYQVIWTRLLVFVFGSTTFATSTVLAVFMGGLALGSFLAGRFADRSRNPFLCYGLLEGAIGVWALAAPVLFSAAIPIYKMFFDQLHLQVIPFGILRFVVAAIILLPPTACMGATLPLLSRVVTESLDKVGDRVGWLYAVNTLGAVLGAVLGGFILIPSLGLNLTTLSAASINFLLGIAVFFLSKIWRSEIEEKATTADSSCAASEAGKLPVEVIAVMASFSVSGALAMFYEVAWTRSLLMVIGSTTYAFTVMLSAFLIGIFLGSFFCARFADRLKYPIVWFALAEILLCFSGIASLWLFNYLPFENLATGYYFGKNLWLNMLCRFLAAGSVLIPITICLGLIFPLAVKVCARDLERIGSSIGRLYSFNTVGAIIGAFLCGFVILPWIGTEQTLLVTSVANLLLGFILLFLFGKLRKGIKVSAGIGCLALIYWAAQSPQIWDYDAMTAAQTERRHLLLPGATMLSFAEWRKMLACQSKLIFYKEGFCANVAIRSSLGLARSISLLVNGHVDASDSADMENQAMLAVYPLMLKPQSADVCVIGWGSGVTAGYALRFPIKSMICAEIEPVVLETSPFFHKVNYIPENDKRTVLEPSDGRNFLLGTAKKFDVIISEPSNPWQAGVCNLFTREYFTICRESLKPGGIFTCWTQTNEIPVKNLTQVFAALKQVFPVVFVMRTGAGDVAALAFCEGTKFNFRELQEILGRTELQPVLARFHLSSAENFLGRLLVCPAGLDEAVKGSEINSDDTNHLEYEVSKSYENRLYRDENIAWLLRNAGPIWDYVDWGPLTKGQKAAEFAKIAEACLAADADRAMLWANQSFKLEPNANAQCIIAEALINKSDFVNASKTLGEGARLYPADARFVGYAGVIALVHKNYLKARALLGDAVKLDNSNFLFRYYLALAYSSFDLGELNGIYLPPPSSEPEKVIELLKDPAQDSRFVAIKPGLLLVLAHAYKTQGKYEQAIATTNKLIRMSPNGYLAWKLLGETFECMKDEKHSAYCRDTVRSLVTPDIPSFIAKAENFRRLGKHTDALRQIQQLLDMSPKNQAVIKLLKDYAAENQDAAKFYAVVSSKQSPAIADPPLARH